MSEVQSLARGLKILNQFIDSDHSLGITELANELHIDKSTVSRLVKTFVNYGYLQPEVGSRRFVPGHRLEEFSWSLQNQTPLRAKAKRYLNWLVEQTDECAHTAVYSQGGTLVIDDVEGKGALRVVGNTGRVIPLHCTAVGKGLIAFGNYPLPTKLNPYTERTITRPHDLKQHLETIRQQGYALDDEEHEPGVRCIAAPVYNYAGIAIATIGISGPTVRITPIRVKAVADLVMRAASGLSQELGFAPGKKRPSDLNGNNHHDEKI
ncbi:IclR family transcriptional regulator [Phototrophicus methaneseepsis]|uniref:IclR family transcriptional regulator n=1 Tax=Phototrophicus methaneseepsis TaxID=2710758 RepID=A0A7S8E6P1_9CHLR|nr:IclR family transcriptional regulator [Phototrophicus methaneseepsis]QPC81366.1 IclR family transcriptional regulator [Phototrophicus methaneseepsis]